MSLKKATSKSFKKRRLWRIFSLILFAVAIFAGAFFANYPLKTGPKAELHSAENWGKDGIFRDFKPDNEVVSMRNATSKHFKNADGTMTGVVSAGLIHYQEDGKWKEILIDIEKNTSDIHSDYAFSTTQSESKRFYPAYSGAQGLLVDFGKEIYKDWIDPEMHWLDADGNTIKSVSAEVVKGTPDANHVTYPSVYKNTDVVFRQNQADRRLDVVLKDKSALDGMPEGAKELAYCEHAVIPEDWTYETKADEKDSTRMTEISLKNGEGIEMIHFVPPTIFEQNSQNEITGKYSLQQEGNTLTVCKVAPLDWLTAPERQFPIVVDPTYYQYAGPYYHGGSSTYYSGTVGGTSYSKWNSDIDVGCWGAPCPGTTEYRRGWAYFDLSGFMDGSTVSSATAYLNQSSAVYGTTDTMTAYYSSVNPLTATGSTLYNGLGYSSIASTSVGTTVGGWYSFSITTGTYGTPYIQSSIGTAGNNYYAIGFSANAATNNVHRFYQYGTGTTAPCMYVTYTTPTFTVNVTSAAGGSTYYVNAGSAITITGSQGIGDGTCKAYWDTDMTFGNGESVLQIGADTTTGELGTDCYANNGVAPSGKTDSTTYYVNIRPVDGYNNAGNYATDSIVYDSIAPGAPTVACGSFVYNVWGSYASPTCTWNLIGGPSPISSWGSTDGGSSWNQSFFGATWDTSFGEGTNTFCARNNDTGGTGTAACFIVKRDQTAPASNSVSINGGAAYIGSLVNVPLTLSSTDATSGTTQMMLSCDNVTYTAARTYSTSGTFDMTGAGAEPAGCTGGYGTKTAYARFKDAAGNWSTAVSDTIQYIAAPTYSSVTPSTAGTTPVTPTSISITGTNLYLGATYPVILYNGTNYVCNNVTSGSSTNFTCDLPAGMPTGYYTIYLNTPAGATNSGSTALSLVAPPTVTSVYSSTANGTYKAGDTILISMDTSRNETVNTTGGTPQLYLETGTTDRYVPYTSTVSGYILRFSYVVQPGDTTSDLEYVNTASLLSNGGTIRDAFNQNLILTLPTVGGGLSLGSTSNIVIDTTAPSITINSVAGDTVPSYYDTTDDSSTLVSISSGDATSCRWSNSNVAYAFMTDCASTSSCYLNNSPDGWYYVYLACSDAVGNITSPYNAFWYAVDSTPPTMTVDSVAGDISAPYYDTTNDSSTHINFLIPYDVVECRWATSSIPYGSMTNTCFIEEGNGICTANLSGEGAKTIYLACLDEAGWTAGPQAVNYTIDTTRPAVLNITSVAGDTTDPYWDRTNDSSTVVAYTASADAVTCKWDTSSVAYASMANTCASTSSCTLNLSGEGAKTVYMGCLDAADLTTFANYALSYGIDSVAPALSSQTTYFGWYNTNQTSNFTYTDATSGIASGNPAACTITTEGTGQTCNVTPNVCDVAGNCNTTQVTSNGADIDITFNTLSISSVSESSNYIYDNGVILFYNNAPATPGSFTINVSATDTYSGVNYVYGSTDFGMIPAADYTSPYALSYTIGQSTTCADNSVGVAAYDNAGNGAGLGHDCTLDTTAPALSSQTSYGTGWYNTDQGSNFNFTDASSGIASGNPASCTISTEGSSSTCSVTPNVCDNVSNCNTTGVTSNSVKLDKTAPSISSITSVAGDSSPPTYYDTTNDSSTSIVFVSYDATSGVSACKWDTVDTNYGAMVNTCASTTNCVANLSGEGDKTVYIRCADVSGLWMTSSTPVSYRIDATQPAITSIISVAGDASAPYYDTLNDSSTVVAYTASADAITCKWNTTDVAYASMANTCESTSSCTLNLAGDGAKTVYMRCLDDAGLVSTSSYTLSYGVDSTAPTISSITSVAGDSSSPYYDTTNDSSTSIVFASSDATSGVSACKWDTTDTTYSSMPNVCSSTTNCVANLSGEGAKTVYIRCADTVGNPMTTSTTVNYTIDSIAPTITSTAPATGAYVNNQNVSYTLSEAVASASIIFTRTGGSTDASSPHTCTLQGSALTTGAHTGLTMAQGANACSQVWNALANGAIYTITFDATDAAGNAATQVSNTSVTYDTGAPVITVTSPLTSSYVNTQNVSYSFTEAAASGAIVYTRTGGATDASSPHTCTLQGTALNSGSHTALTLATNANACVSWTPLADGTIYTVTFDATDLAANPASTVTSTLVTFDATVPTINSITSVAGDTGAPYFDATNDSSTSIVFTSSDATSGVSACKWDTSNVAYASMANTCASTTNCVANLSGEGAKIVYLRCADTAGNPMTTSTTVNYTIDSRVPALSTLSASEGEVLGGETITLNGSGFVSGATVLFGSTPSTSVTFVGTTQLTAVVPPHSAGAVNVTVTNPNEQSSTLSSSYTYVLLSVTKFGDGTADYTIAASTPTDLVFSLGMTSGQKTAIQNALTAGADNTLGYAWSGNNKTLTVTTSVLTTFAYDVIVTLTHSDGSTSDLLLVDSITATSDTTNLSIVIADALTISDNGSTLNVASLLPSTPDTTQSSSITVNSNSPTGFMVLVDMKDLSNTSGRLCADSTPENGVCDASGHVFSGDTPANYFGFTSAAGAGGLVGNFTSASTNLGSAGNYQAYAGTVTANARSFDVNYTIYAQDIFSDAPTYADTYKGNIIFTIMANP